MAPRSSLIGLVARPAAHRASRLSIEPVPDQRRGGFVGDNLRRRDRAKDDTRVRAHTVAIERDIDPDAHDGNVHLRPRNKAQIGVRLMRLWLWHTKLDDELALFERGPARPGDDRPTGLRVDRWARR